MSCCVRCHCVCSGLPRAREDYAFMTKIKDVHCLTVQPATPEHSPGARPRRRMHEPGPGPTGRRQGSPCSSSHLASCSWCPPQAADSRTMTSIHGAPCSRAHCITSRCPPSGVCACPLIPLAVVLPRPLQHRQVSAESGEFARPLIHWAVVRTRPLQYVQVPA